MNGDANEKSRMAFNIIDKNNKGFFEKSDFIEMINSIVISWSALTGKPIGI